MSPPIPAAHLEHLARVLGDCGTGGDLEDGMESTKWKRLNRAFTQDQSRSRCAGRVLKVIEFLMTPARYADRKEFFESQRMKLNVQLAFIGMECGKDGRLRAVSSVRTLDEAEQRVQTLQAKLKGRRMHPEVLKYCRAELMEDNYFHAVFEAAKGLMQRIREMSGEGTDGVSLIDKVFSVEAPLLAFNSLRTETERSEHKGFAALLKGCHAAVRNPLAHEPKLLWDGEDDAADYLSLLSLLHRKLDACVRTGKAPC